MQAASGVTVDRTLPSPSNIDPGKPTRRNLAWQRNVKILVGVSCGLIIVCGAAHFSGQISQAASYAMFGLMGAGGLGIAGGWLALRQLKKIDEKIQKGDDAGDTRLAAAVRKGQERWAQFYLVFGANPHKMGKDNNRLFLIAPDERMKNLIMQYGG